MAEPGDTLEQIAADELARLSKVTEVLKGIPDNAREGQEGYQGCQGHFIFKAGAVCHQEQHVQAQGD